MSLSALYQYCNHCKTERNFKYVDSFEIQCTTCQQSYTPQVKQIVKFSSMAVNNKNSHLSNADADKLFDSIVGQQKKVDPLEAVDVPMDVRKGVVGTLPKQGRDIVHTPIDIRTPEDLATTTNLRLFLQGDPNKDNF